MITGLRRAVILLAALALMLVAWAHQTLSAGPDLSAYAMPDGSLPDLCLTQDGDTQADHAPCPACTLVAAMGAPDAGLPLLIGVVRLADWRWSAAHLRSPAQPRAPPARGPPSLLLV